VSPDGRYCGERLDLGTEDLGQYLKNIQHSRGLAPRVVLHLTGSGDQATSPIKVDGVRLVLYFEPGGAGGKPLRLVPRAKNAAAQDALIEVTQGSLTLMGAGIALPDGGPAGLPGYLIAVRGGDLVLVGCRLQGPPARPHARYHGLVFFEGSGDALASRAHACTLQDCVLASPRTCLHMAGVGIRLRMNQCVLLAGDDGLHLQPGPLPGPRLNFQCALDHNTLAVKRAAVRLMDTLPIVPAQPIYFLADANVFVDPFEDGPREAGVLLAERGALGRGLLAWQGANNLYDRRLRFFAACADAPLPAKPPAFAAWQHLWSGPGDLHPVLDRKLTKTCYLDQSLQGQLETLNVAAAHRGESSPGADPGRANIATLPAAK
jgi:hypothetical protein